MQIYVHTDNNIDGRVEMASYVEREVATALSRLSDHVTRIDVHLGAERAGKSTGASLRCMIEARPAGQSPVTATEHAGSLDEAVHGALHRLNKLLESDSGRMGGHNNRASIRGHADQ